MTGSVLRLLSPTCRRIVTIDDARRRNDPHIEGNLRHAGWTEYRGQGRATSGYDESGRSVTARGLTFRGSLNGWVIPGTDPDIDAFALPITQNDGRDSP